MARVPPPTPLGACSAVYSFALIATQSVSDIFQKEPFTEDRVLAWFYCGRNSGIAKVANIAPPDI